MAYDPNAYKPDPLQNAMSQHYTGTVMQNGNRVQMVNGVVQQAAAPGAAGTTPTPTPTPTTPALGSGSGTLGGANGWMTSGGLDPTGWMNFGGAPNTGFLNMGNWSQNTADPGSASASTDPLQGYQPFIDSSYAQATRQLDPQIATANSNFQQDMVNKGIAPGSDAWNQAKSALDQTSSDAYAQARAQAQTQGLAAQQQSFGQGYQNSQLANSLAQSLIGANSSYANQQLGGNANIMNALIGGNQGIQQAQIGGAATRGAAASSAGASQYASNLNHEYQMGMLGQQGQQNDFNNLMSLLSGGQGVNTYNNNLLTSDQQRQQSLYSGLPGAGGSAIDVQSPYNNQYTGQMNQYNANQQQANAQNQSYAQYAALIASMFG